MKKVLSIMLIAVMAMLVLATQSKATTKEELKDYIFADHVIAGTTYSIRSEDKEKVERFFNTHQITDAQATEIKSLIDEVINQMSEDYATRPNGISSTAKKQELFAYAQRAAGILGLTISYDASNERVDIYENGVKLDSINWGVTKSMITTKSGSNKRSPLVQTGSTNYIYAVVAGVILIAGIAFVVIRKKNNATV